MLQVSSEAVHVCTEYCEDIHCVARARSVGATSSETEEEPEPEPEVYSSTHAENVLSPELMAHFSASPSPQSMVFTLVEDFVRVRIVH